jgi:hypothetical protein
VSFPDILLPVIFYFGGDGSLCIGDFSDPLPLLLVSTPLPFDNRLYLRSYQGLFMIDLLDNTLNLLKLFLTVAVI